MKNILIIKTHAIGDVIMTTAAIRELRKSLPDSRISMLVGKWSSQIIKNNPNINECIEFEDDILHKKKIFEIIKLVFKVHSRKFDTAIIFHPSVAIHFITSLAGIKNRFGLSRNRKSFFLSASNEENGSYDYYYPLNFIKLVHLATGSKPIKNNGDARLEVFSSAIDRIAVDKLLKNHGVNNIEKCILIAPGGAVNPKEHVSARVWPIENYIKLINLIKLEFKRHSILISGGKNDIYITKRICYEIPEVIDLSGKTSITELVYLVGICRVVVCNDSSVLHMGIAQNRPTIGVFGPTSMPSRVPSDHWRYSIQSTEKCSPCYYFGQFKGCKKNMSCMRSILPEQVFQKVRDALQPLS
jgi:heptosyltransferase II